MRILHVTASPVLGGLQRIMLTLVEGQLRNGVSAAVAVSPGGPFPEHLRSKALPCGEIPMERGLSLRSVLELRRFAERFEADVLHAHGARATLYSYLCSRGTKRALVSHVHLADPWRFDGSWASRLDRLVCSRVDRVVACSRQLRGLLVERQGLAEGRTECVPNGIQLEEFLAAGRPPAGTGPIFGTCARLEHQKGLTHLLEAFAALARIFPGSRLRIAGDGSLRGQLQALAKSLDIERCVEWLGHRSDVVAVMTALDVFVLPSLAEGLPLAVIEAMAAGVPVIATDIPGTSELIEHDQTGLLVHPGSSAALAEAMRMVAEDPRSARTRALAAREYVREHHDAHRMEEAVRALYARILAERTARA